MRGPLRWLSVVVLAVAVACLPACRIFTDDLPDEGVLAGHWSELDEANDRRAWNQARSLAKLAQGAAQEGRVESALRRLDRAALLSPSSSEPLRFKGALLAHGGARPEAVEALAEAARRAADGAARDEEHAARSHAEILVMRAAILSQMGRDDEALADVFEAERGPGVDEMDRADRITLVRMRGALLLKTGRVREAADAYEELVDMEPGDADAWAVLGELHEEGGRIGRAEAAYQAALSAEARHVDATLGMARVLRERAETEGDRELLRKAVTRLRVLMAGMGPDDPDMPRVRRAYEDAATALTESDPGD